jgi:hypothetical protein
MLCRKSVCIKALKFVTISKSGVEPQGERMKKLIYTSISLKGWFIKA